MRTFLLAALLCFAVSVNGVAQTPAGTTPASKEDVEKYQQVSHARENMQNMVDAMMRPIHQTIHDQYQKNQAKLPADFEARMNQLMEDYMKAMPFDEMLDAMVPVYQKHFSKEDIGALTAFYSTKIGQDILHEMPAVAAESVQSMTPLIRQQMEGAQKRLQQSVEEMMKEPPSQPAN